MLRADTYDPEYDLNLFRLVVAEVLQSSLEPEQYTKELGALMHRNTSIDDMLKVGNPASFEALF